MSNPPPNNNSDPARSQQNVRQPRTRLDEARRMILEQNASLTNARRRNSDESGRRGSGSMELPGQALYQEEGPSSRALIPIRAGIGRNAGPTTIDSIFERAFRVWTDMEDDTDNAFSGGPNTRRITNDPFSESFNEPNVRRTRRRGNSDPNAIFDNVEQFNGEDNEMNIDGDDDEEETLLGMRTTDMMRMFSAGPTEVALLELQRNMDAAVRRALGTGNSLPSRAAEVGRISRRIQRRGSAESEPGSSSTNLLQNEDSNRSNQRQRLDTNNEQKQNMAAEEEEVDLELLDQMTRDYLIYNGLGAQLTESLDHAPSIYKQHLPLLHQFESLKDILNQGFIREAIFAIGELNEKSLNRPSMCYALYKQEFIEILRSQGHNSQPDLETAERALNLARKHLAPSTALSLSSSAFEDFKHLLLALVLGKEGAVHASTTTLNRQDPKSALEILWSLDSRKSLARFVHQSILSDMGVTSPQLSILIRYLFLVHQRIKTQHSGSEKLDELIKTLKLNETSTEAMYYEMDSKSHDSTLSVNQNDAEMLASALDLSQEETTKLLRASSNNSEKAFYAALAIRNIDENALLEMIQEYAVYRGLEDSISPLTENGSILQESERLLSCLKTLRHAVEEGELDIDHIIAQIIGMDESFLDDDIPTIFQLYEFKFLQCIQSSNLNEAMSVLRKHLSPLTLRDGNYVARLKKCTPWLLNTQPLTQQQREDLDDRMQSVHPRHALRSFHIHMTEKWQWQTPRLVQLFKYLLYSHDCAFAYRHEKDPFATFIGIDQLNKTIRDSVPEDQALRRGGAIRRAGAHQHSSNTLSNSQNGSRGASNPSIGATQPSAAPIFLSPQAYGFTELSGIQLEEENEADDPAFPIPEESITMLMDVMGFSRREARALLRRHDGILANAFASLFH